MNGQRHFTKLFFKNTFQEVGPVAGEQMAVFLKGGGKEGGIVETGEVFEGGGWKEG